MTTNKKTAIITGATGQDGSYLAEFLLSQDYRVIGIARRSSVDTTERLQGFSSHPKFELIEGDVTDAVSMFRIVEKFKPDELYNLCAMSHVHTSFEQPLYTFQVDTLGVLNLLEAIRMFSPATRFYQASTSEMFGDNYSFITEEGEVKHSNFNRSDWTVECGDGLPYQDENTPFNPRSPYAVAKLAAHNLVSLYRDAYGLFACCGILFNHESPRRGDNFVTQKIARYIQYLGEIGEYSLGDTFPFFPGGYEKLKLGNIHASRDWGHAADYVVAMWSMLQNEKPTDYVVATGETHTVKEFLDLAFSHIGIINWSNFVECDDTLLRPAEVPYLRGNPAKVMAELDWQPTYTFHDLVEDMVNGEET